MMFRSSGMELDTYAMEATRFLDQEEVLLVWATADRKLEQMTLVMDRYPSTYPVFEVIRTYATPHINNRSATVTCS